MKWFLKKCFRKKKPEMKPGAILDQVISQSTSNANTCLLYKLANYKRGGDLIDALQTGGQIAVEQLIREQFGVFMYNNGKGQIINRAEYLRWKYRDNHEVVIPIEASLSQYDPLGKWADHKACWQMQYRGSLGESLLHVLIICDTKIHTKLARILLRVFPNLSLDVMEGEEYLGASALHLAIAYSNNELVADLVEAGALISQRATGSFFLPRDQQKSKPAKNTDYEGLAYLGEYPLAWAACCANESVYNLLMDNGADPDLQDSFGNMILHMVVVCDKLDMFGYALRHPRTPARNGIVNHSGLTPLTLACKLGRAEVFREMLELSSREFWRYSNITCSGYPLNALDTLLPDGRTNWNSALFIILNGTKEEHLDMLDGGIIQRLLEEKWKTFARNQFLKRLLILFIHLFFLSISVYLRPATQNSEVSKNVDHDENESLMENRNHDEFHEKDNMDIRTVIRYCCELATIAGVLSYVILQQGDEVKNQGLTAFVKQLPHTPAKLIFLVSNFMILACIPFRIMGDTNTEEAILVCAVPGSWFLLMFFAGAVRLTGPFVTMIYSMLTGDMFTFGIIYVIILFGFSQAFYFLFKGHAQVQTTLFSSYPTTWMALFQTTLGDYNYQELNQTSYPNLAKTVFVVFMIFVPILLLNMLIAMMGNTYAHVIEQSEKEWMKQWAKIVVTLERAVPQTDAQKYLEAYSIPLGASDDSGFIQRGVMVIKSKSKTRAKQRKGAVANWKRVGKVTLNELKKRGMSGEELRRIMWGRASITSPTKISKIKRKDPYNIYEQCDTGLNAALDVMAFAQDINLSSDLANPIPADLKTQIPAIAPNNAMSNLSSAIPGNKLDPSKTIPIVSTHSVLTGTTTITTTSTNTTKATLNVPQPVGTTVPKQTLPAATTNMNQPTTPKTELDVDTKDPLRELVLISETAAELDTTYLSNVKLLANQARVIGEAENRALLAASERQKSAPNAAPLSAGAEITNLTSIFQDPKDMVDPEKERAFYKLLEELDDTEDSDGFIERPVLGKISLIRRAKSAVSRTSAQKTTADRYPLFKFAWEEPAEQLLESGASFANKAYEDEIITATTTADNETCIQIEEDKSGNNLEQNETKDEEIVTVEEVKQKMTEFHLRRRSPPKETERENRKSYSGRRHSNKVSPEFTDEYGKNIKRGKSAQETSYKKRGMGKTRSDSPPDPLEPWSTRDLANINEILHS